MRQRVLAVPAALSPLLLWAFAASRLASAPLPPEPPVRFASTCVSERVDAVGVEVVPLREAASACSGDGGRPELLAGLRP
jgi:hypothetical protein